MATYLSDIEIAQQTKLVNIETIGEKLGLNRDTLELYGNHKAKIDPTKLGDLKEKGKVILVTAITPTPAGEGKQRQSLD